MPIVRSIIDSNNKRKLRRTQIAETAKSECLTKEIIYQATVEPEAERKQD